jgi:CubicO group peptidase (beta-lactamase class C family)
MILLLNQTITSNEVDILEKKALKEFNLPGVVVAIVKDGKKIIHEKGYGVKSIETKFPVDEHTNF